MHAVFRVIAACFVQRYFYTIRFMTLCELKIGTEHLFYISKPYAVVDIQQCKNR